MSQVLDQESVKQQMNKAMVDDSSLPLQVFNANKSFRAVGDAVRNSSFVLESGQSLGIAGANGAGKTTLLNLIMGDYFLSKGNVKSFGSGILLSGLRNCFYLRDIDVLFEELTVEEHFRLYSILTGMDKTQIMYWIDTFELVAKNRV